MSLSLALSKKRFCGVRDKASQYTLSSPWFWSMSGSRDKSHLLFMRCRVDCSRILSPPRQIPPEFPLSVLYLFLRHSSFSSDISLYLLREVTLKAFLPPSLSVLSALSSSSARRAFERELWPLLEFPIVRQLANGVGWSVGYRFLFPRVDS